MGRSILGAVLGYVCMVIVVMLGAGLQWLILGAEGAFAEGSTVASTSWAALACVSGLVAAVVGGVVASKIEGSGRSLGWKILIGIILVLGLASAVAATMAEPKVLPEGKSLADMGFVEAGQYASSPAWFNWLIPIVGAVGTAIGATFVRPKPTPVQTDQ